MVHSNELKILFIEDVDADFELAENELRSNGISFSSIRVENSCDFEKGLMEFKPDLVISDYSLPQFNGMMALKISKEFDESLPFIILTGTLNEEIAVECMKAGATDYVIKEHIAKLSFAVKEAFRFRNAMSEKIKAEAALLESESRYRSLFEKNQVVMLLINPDSNEIVDANPAALDYYGFNSKDDICIKLSDIIIADDIHVEDRIKSAIDGNLKRFTSKHKLNNGIVRDVEAFCSPVSYMGKQFVHLIIQDITERNSALEALQRSLDEKKELIREIYHRTNNSMQIIISMFSLQSMFVSDIILNEILKDMGNRIRAMALVHEKLYKEKDLSRINLKDYLTELVESIFADYSINEDKIKINFIMDDIDVLIDSAIPCGLVINELVTNTAKHAFPGDKRGMLYITLSLDNNGEIRLIIADDGIGMNLEDENKIRQTMGLQIVINIVEHQLKGYIVLEKNVPDGLKWIIRFIDDKYKERIQA